MQDPAPVLAALFRFLGVNDAPDIVAPCVGRNSFASATAGRATGDGAFFRSTVSRDWRGTLSPALNALVLRDLGWMFPVFGWAPE